MLNVSQKGNPSALRNKVLHARENGLPQGLPFTLHTRTRGPLHAWDIEQAIHVRQERVKSLLSCAVMCTLLSLVGLYIAPEELGASGFNVLAVLAHMMPLLVVLPIVMPVLSSRFTAGIDGIYQGIAEHALAPDDKGRDKAVSDLQMLTEFACCTMRRDTAVRVLLTSLVILNTLVAAVASLMGEVLAVPVVLSLAFSGLVLLRNFNERNTPAFNMPPQQITGLTYAGVIDALVDAPSPVSPENSQVKGSGNDVVDNVTSVSG